ncbi:hypothetical protein K443DRAFT_68428, partial [Laccaria amethystina LaAM-08-1]
LSAPPPRFSTTKGQFLATNKPLRWGQQAAAVEYARLACLCGLSELEELWSLFNVGLFYSYIHIDVDGETTQMIQEHQHTYRL